MKRTAFYRFGGIAAVIAALVCTGCFGKSQSTRFYTLSAMANETDVALQEGTARNIAVGIGPIKMAAYLDRSKIVTRTGGNRIELAEYDQWAGSFEDNLKNVLADNIGVLVPTERIYLYPWRTTQPIDYQVVLDIVRLDGRLGEEVQLEVRWQVLAGEKQELLAVKRSSLTETVSGPDYEDLVAAQSRALAKLSREIVETIHADSRTRLPAN
jgi:uncharacterized lipoprotein YmbA